MAAHLLENKTTRRHGSAGQWSQVKLDTSHVYASKNGLPGHFIGVLTGIRRWEQGEEEEEESRRGMALQPGAALINSRSLSAAEPHGFKHQDYGGGTPHTGRHMKANVVCG